MQARLLTTRLMLVGTLVTGAGLTAGLTGVPGAGAAAAPLTLTETWNAGAGVVLNDAPCGVALASPVAFSDGGTPAVEVGDRSGHLYGLTLADGSVAPGWGSETGATVGPGEGCDGTASGGTPGTGIDGVEVPGNPPIDSTASLTADGTLTFGGGNAASAVDGGYYAYSPNGSELWNQVVTNPPTDDAPDSGVQASLSVADLGTLVEGGSLGQETYALDAANGSAAAGWPQFSGDSVFSTAATGDLYGTGSDDFVVGGASSQGFAYGRHYADGGHLRIYNDHGGLICEANTNEEIDSSPAVGPILPGGAYGIATGTGSFWHGSDQDTVKMYDTKCQPVWSDRLDGTTGGSPALADVEGNGSLAVVEGTVSGTDSGSVWALDAATGATIWKTSLPGAVYGSVTTADLTGDGTQDVIVPTDQGLFILDGPTGQVVADVDDGSGDGGVSPSGAVVGFQNAALVTADANGTIGITVAGYFAVSGGNYVQGMVQHFEVAGSDASLVDASGGWPQFHHDPQLTGFVGSGNPLSPCDRPDAAQRGYLAVASDGGIFAFGQDFCGSTGGLTLNQPVVGAAAVPGQGGYWLVAADGGVFSYGDAGFYGSAAAVPGQDIAGIAATPDGLGYWEVSSAGHVFAFGDATFFGDLSGVHLNAPIVGMAPDPVTGGYWLLGSDGGVFAFGAPFFGSTGAIRLNQPVVGMQSTADGQGYWFVAADGGVFAYGDAPFRGSMGGQPLNRPMVGIAGF